MTRLRSPSNGKATVARTVLSMTGTAALAALVAAATNILMARALGPAARGHVAFLLQAAYFLAPLTVLAADRAVLRAKNDSSFESVWPTTRWILGASAVVGLIFAWLFGDARVLIILILPTVAWFNLRRAQAISNRASRSYVVPFMTWQICILLASALLFVTGVTQWWAWALLYGAPALLVFLKAGPQRELRHSRAAWRNSLQLTVGATTQIFSTRGERLLLPFMAGPSQLGLYAVIATATEPLYWLGQTLADHRAGERATRPSFGSVVRLVVRDLLLFAPVAFVLAIALRWIVVPIFGDSFAPAVSLVTPLALAALVLVLYRQLAGLLLNHAPNRVGTAELVTAVLAAVVYPVMIARWGGSGAAWGSVVVYAVGFLAALLALTVRPERENS